LLAVEFDTTQSLTIYEHSARGPDRTYARPTIMSSASPRLSAVIPNFNHGAVVGEAIRAIAGQTPAADEIIVVDDGSTDNSAEVLERLSKEIPRLLVLRLEENRGAIFALNHGLKHARGDYVNFGAADDLVRPGLFAAMLEVLALHPQAAFACCEAIVAETESGRTEFRPPVRPSNTETYFEPIEVRNLLRRIDNWILSGTALVRRDLVLDLGGFDPALGAFTDGFLFRKLALRHGFCFVPRLGLTWRVSTTGLSRLQAANFASSMAVLASAVSRMRADADFPSWYPEIFERRWRFAIGRIAASAHPMNRAVLVELSRGPVGRTIMTVAAGIGGQIGRVVVLVWLTLLYRPTSLVGLVKTAIARYRIRRSLKAQCTRATPA
jgi:glycosyltransferase involved in cell wall biosynthesis